MSTRIIQLLRSHSFAVTVHVGSWVLLYLVLVHLGGHAPEFREAAAYSVPLEDPIPVSKLGSLFSAAQWPHPLSDTNTVNPFQTLYFVPRPAPAPPPPTTRKIEVTYQGFYQTGNEPKQAVVKVADTFVIAPVGRAVATNLFIAQATMQSLTLTNLASQTNLLLLNAKKEIEVPIQ